MGNADRFQSYSRRDVLRFGVSAGLIGALPGLATADTSIRVRTIPVSGEQLPVIGLGTSRVFDVGEEAAERDPCRDVLRGLLAAGGSVLDSSPMYRRAESVSGDLAADLDVTDRVFWATKVWADGAEAGVEQMQKSLNLFRTDQIDLMQVHNLRDWRAHMPALREWQEQERIRYLGITHSRSAAFEEVETVISQTKLDFVQLNYSLGEREAEGRLLPLCADKGIAVLVNRPFMKGALFKKVGAAPLPDWAADFDVTTWGQFFLKFILAHPTVTCVIPATRKPGHMIDNLAAGFGSLPDEKQRQAMKDYFSAI